MGFVYVGDRAYQNSWVEPGKAIRQADNPHCKAVCPTHGRGCNVGDGTHSRGTGDVILHVCTAGQWGHHFCAEDTA